MKFSEEILTVALVTLIWIIQILHYPFFRFLPEDKFAEAMVFHQQRISWIVFPLMVTELVVSFYRAALGLPGSSLILACVVLIWLSTGFIQVPLHNKLNRAKDLTAIRKLVRTNWIRTALWTLKAILVFNT